MRALKIVTVVMGVMIIAGTAVLAVLIAKRLSGSIQRPASFAVQLAEPDGTRIAGIAVLQDRLAIQLEGGGPDRVVMVDPRTGASVGQIAIVPRTGAPIH
jgi:hypothetical protein